MFTDTAPLLSILNPQRKVLQGPHLLHHLVHATPESTVALDFYSSEKEPVQVTYQQLHQLSDQLASRLTTALTEQYGPNKDAENTIIVPVLIPQSPELYVSQIAILKSGAAFCPLNLDAPPERLAFILKDVGAKLVVTTQECRHRLSSLGHGLDILALAIDVDEGDIAADSRASIASQAKCDPSSLAYVMYTSGSTGLPKGVGVTHGAVTQALLAHDEHVPRYHRFLQFAAPTFDVSVFEIFFTFYRGATLVCCHREDMLNDLPGVIKERKVDAAELTPTVASTLVRNWDAVPCLKLLLTIGEMLPRAVIENFASDPERGRILLPMYGPTEASIHCTVASTMDVELRAGTIGRPLSTVSAIIIAEGQTSEPDILPIGHIGELAVAGQLAQGYINRPEETRAAFIELPGYGLVYRTGDRARLTPGGQLECLGRISSGQVKIRGQRVELGEIEQVIGQVNNVRFVVASIIDGNLVTFCLLDDGTSMSDSKQAIQDKCRAWLPPFMRPNDFVFLTQNLPRLPSGKVDKQGLEVLYRGQIQRLEPDIDDFASDLDKLVSEVIATELGIKVACSEDLWSKGLDSLRSIRVASKLREKGLEVAATDILSVDTIAELSRALQRVQPSPTLPVPANSEVDYSKNMKEVLKSELSTTEFQDLENIVPCSKLQLAMISETVIAKHLNFNWLKMELANWVPVTDFLEAFSRLAKLNDILRSGFVHSPQTEAHFARVIWKGFDHVAQVRYGRSDPAGTYGFESDEYQDMSLLRPLRLKIFTYGDHTTVMVYIHHALYDGWSWDLLMADLHLLLSGGGPVERPQFQDFVQCEEAFLRSQNVSTAQEYWAGHLGGVVPASLPILTQVKCEANMRTFRRTSKVNLPVVDAMSQRLRISRQIIPSAAFATLLSFYCGSPEVVFGCVSSGRTLSLRGVENIIGPCISTLPIRINLSHLRTVGDLLLHTQSLQHNLLYFGQLPLRDIRKAAGITDGQALFEALFVWQESLERQEDKKPALSVMDATDSLHYTLVLELEPKCDQLHVKATFDTSIICVDQIELLLSEFEAIVAYYAEFPDNPWDEVPGHILVDDLSIANRQLPSVDPAMGVSSTVDHLAQSDPSRPAIDFVDDYNPLDGTMKVSQVSYRELSRKAGAAASFLLSRGVSIGELVCLFMTKSIELYISILGVLKAGAAYIVVDPQAPRERIRRILASAKCRYSLTKSNFEDHEALDNVDNVLLFDKITESAHHEIILPTVSGTKLAYAVFTSGSTGVPKGVLITRNNILSNIEVLSRIYPLVANGSLLQACSPTFDVSVFEILYTWNMGMRLCAASNDILFRDIEGLIQRLNITHLSLTPAVAALVRPANVPNVHVLVTAGDSLTPKVFLDWSGRGLYQGYGPSEATNICSLHGEVSSADHLNNIGRPLPNTSMFISSCESFRPLPKGSLGEIWIGGDQLGQGYLNDTDLTAEKFIDHPEYGRLYRSGDLGRMLPDCSILFHGRQDDQVKLRGHRIELGEVEHALLEESVVSNGVCLLIEGSGQTAGRVVAYWSPTTPLNGDPISYSSSIFESLSSRLPAYMMPDYLIHIDVLPLTPSGKSDRKALKQLFSDMEPAALIKRSFTREHTVGHEDLTHPDEKKLAQAITEVTGAPLSAIGRNTSFFALGLDSINCISLSKKLLKAGFKQVDVSVILHHASVAKLLKAFSVTSEDAQLGRSNESMLQDIFDRKWQESVNRRYAQKGLRVHKILPCTPLQQAMLSESEGADNGAYQNRLTFSILGNLQQVKAAWSTCVAVHEILRTSFILTNSSSCPFAQVVLANFASPWNSTSGSVRAESDWESVMMPPYSLSVIEEPGSLKTSLLLDIHHALYDAHAVSLLLHDVERVYRNCPLETVPSLEPYLEYMVDVEEGHADDFWRAHLTGYRPKLLSRPPLESKAGVGSANLLCHISSKNSLQTLIDTSKQTSVTILSLLQLAWARLLADYSDDPDVCFGNVYSGRNLPVRDVEKIVGPCFNTLPIRITLGKRDTNQQIARRLQDHNLAALRFQPFPLRVIQRSQEVGRLFDTLILLQAAPVELDHSIWMLEKDIGEMKFPMILEIIPHPRSNQLDFLLHAEGGLLSPSAAEAILEDFDILLENIIRYPDALATDRSILRCEKPLTLLHGRGIATATAATHAPRHSFENEWSRLERFVCDVFRKVSQSALADMKKDTTIFHLGFDSISAIHIAAVLRKEGYRVSTGDVLEAATVPQIASLCEKSLSNGLDQDVSFDFDTFNKKHLAEICRRLSIDQAVVEVRPCTAFQSGILADFGRSQGAYYLNSVEFELDSDADLCLLRKAWEVVCSRNDILRTGFVEIDDVQSPFAMVVYQPGICPLPISRDDAPPVQSRAVYAQSLLDSLHEPAWHLWISNEDIHKRMRLSMLHALFDARTLELLLSEVATAYRGAKLPEVVPIKSCLSKILHESRPDAAAKTSNPIDLDTMHSAKLPNLHSHHLEDEGFQVTEDDSYHSLRQLQASCRKAGVTLQVAGQCAWARLLSAYTGESVCTFGVVLSGRSIENGEQAALFPCINTVDVSMKVGGITNRTLLADAAKRNAMLMKNPFGPSQRKSGLQNELFDTLFVFQNRSEARPSYPWKVLDEDSGAGYVASIEILADWNDDIRFRLISRKQTVPVNQGRLLVRQFDALILDTLAHLDDQASNMTHIDSNLLSIVPAKDPLIRTEVECLHQFVEISSQILPGKVAFEFAVDITGETAVKMSWTYSQLDGESNKIAHMLQRHGACPGDLIGICFDKCPEASFTILAILKAGCAYVALDPHAPEARKRFIMVDSDCRILCTTQDKAKSLELGDNLRILGIDELLKENDFPCNNVILPRKLVKDDICYCLYTSGTTGTPKGCLITHGNAVQFILAFQRLLAGHWDANSCFLQFASFHFDVSVLEQFWSWSIGICVTSAPRDLLFEDLSASIRALQITHLDLTPSLARLLTPQECPSLRRGAFITGGEQLRQDIIDMWGEESILYNAYGPSEVTIGCTMYPRIPKLAKASNIGYAYDNVEAYVLEANTKHAVLKGGLGELCVSGPLVSRGYLNRPELTAEKFEFHDHLQVQIYHTGDLVRLLHDGSFCFIGRVDDQVKLRGQRLEVGEINHVVSQSSKAIKAVATMVWSHSKESKEQLVTFFASSERRVIAEQSAIDHGPELSSLIHCIYKACNSALPAYMVPTYIIPVTMMPLSANNKIDNKALKALFEAAPPAELKRLSVAGTSQWTVDREATQKVIGVISQVVGLPEDAIFASSRLVELGLDSISAISLSRMLKRARFAEANPSLIMRDTVVADLVRALTDSRHSEDVNNKVREAACQSIAAFARSHRSAIEEGLGISDDDIDKIAPCTPLQEGMIARTLSADDFAYFSSFTYSLATSLDVTRLQAAWVHVKQKNEILRTKFVPTADGYAQVVLKDSPKFPPKFRTSSLNREASYEDVFKQDHMRWCEHVRNLDDELWELNIYHTPTRILMTLRIFHALYDGISLALILEEVACNIAGEQSIHRTLAYHDVLPLGPLTYSPSAKDFWTKHLHMGHLLDLPIQHDVNESVAASSHFAPCRDVKQLRLQLGVTEPAILLSCWLMTLEQRFGIFPTVGIVVSGRALDIDGIETVVGPMFNTIPCQIVMHDLSTMADLVRACHSFYVENMPYQHTPLSRISKWLGLHSTAPLFDSLFVFQRKERRLNESLKLWTQIDSRSQSDYPLALEVEQSSDGSFLCTIVAQGQYLQRQDVEQLLEMLKKNLGEALKDPYEPYKLSNDGSSGSLDASNTKSPLVAVAGSKQVTNGTDTRDSAFEWDAISKTLRHEIAQLSTTDIDDVGPCTSIFELGLDSIDVIKLSARLKAAKISISVSSILQAGSIAEIVKGVAGAGVRIDATSDAILGQAVEDLRRSLEDQGVRLSGYNKVLPVTPLQEGMLANYHQYYSQDVLKLSEGIDVEKLKSAWSLAVFTHDILRTSFVEVDDPQSAFTYAQLVSPDVKFECRSTTLRDEAELQTLLSNHQADSRRRGISQAALHLTFVRIGPTTYLVIGLPHAVYDGWSINLLHQDVAKCYSGLQCVRPSYEPILQQALEAVSEISRSFWADKLSGLRPRKFDLRRDASQPGHPATTDRRERASKISVTQAIAFCRTAGVTLQSLALTCWALVLSHTLQCRDVCFGMVLAGRDIEDAHEMMFPAMNTVPFRITLQGGSRLEMVTEVHKLAIAISVHQHFPLRIAKSFVEDHSGQLFDSLFIYQKRPAQSELKPLYESMDGYSEPEYPVNMEMEVFSNDLVWRAACKNDRLDAAGTEALLRKVDDVLGSIIVHPLDSAFESSADQISICDLPTFNQWTSDDDTWDDEQPAKSSYTYMEQSGLSPQEEIISRVLADIANVGREQITRSTTLFHLGLDSISAIKVSSALKKQEILLPVSEMLKVLTVAQMAEIAKPLPVDNNDNRTDQLEKSVRLLGQDWVRQRLERANIQEDRVEDVLLCTSGQEFFLAVWQVSGGRLFYPEFHFRIRGPYMHRQKINAAWDSLVQAVPMLRTVFLSASNPRLSSLQVVLKEALTTVVWTADGSQNSEDGDSVVADDGGPPVMLIATSLPDAVILKLRIHHALYDGVSLPLMMNAFKSFCKSSTWTPKVEIDFHGYLDYLQRHTIKERQKAFWSSYLKGLPSSQPHGTASFRSERVQVFRASLIGDLTLIEKKLRRSGISFQALFFTAYALLHARLVGRPSSRSQDMREIVVGMYLANRSHDDERLSELLAPTVCIVPLKIPVRQASSLLESASIVQDDLAKIGSVEHCTVSLPEIHEWTGVTIDCFVNFLRLPDMESSLDPSDEVVSMEEIEAKEGIQIDAEEEPRPRPFADAAMPLQDQDIYRPSIDVEAAVRNGMLDMGIFAPTDLLDTDGAEGLLSELQALLLSFGHSVEDEPPTAGRQHG